MQYPMVELATGTVFALLFVKFQDIFFVNIANFSVTYGYYVALSAILIAIFVYDLKHKIIPDSLSLIFGILAFIGMFLFTPIGFFPHMPVLSDFLAGFAVSVPFALIWLLSRGRMMGLGDGKLLVGLGFMLGMLGIVSATIIAFWIGGIVGVFLLVFSKKYGRRSEVPFAPFLILGTMLVFIFDIYLPLF